MAAISGGGGLIFDHEAIDQTSTGLLTASKGTEIFFDRGPRFRAGGTVSIAAGAELLQDGHSNDLTGVTLINSGLVKIDSGGVSGLTVSGTITKMVRSTCRPFGLTLNGTVTSERRGYARAGWHGRVRWRFDHAVLLLDHTAGR